MVSKLATKENTVNVVGESLQSMCGVLHVSQGISIAVAGIVGFSNRYYVGRT